MATTQGDAPPYLTDEVRTTVMSSEVMEGTRVANLAPDPEYAEELDQQELAPAPGVTDLASQRDPLDAAPAAPLDAAPPALLDVAPVAPLDAARSNSDMPGPGSAVRMGRATFAQGIAYLRTPSNARYVALLSISVIALLMSLLNFGLITGSLRIPAPGLQTQGATGLTDHATYAFEYDTEAWQARGAATSAVWNNSHRFAGQGALEVQLTALSPTDKGFVYITVPPDAKPGSTITAHVYVPSGTPPIIATFYALDGSWAWSSGGFPAMNPGTWTALTYSIPATLQGPIREMGVMIVGVSGNPPYSGVLFIDSVNVQN
ncbi:MAG TPA: hypothetical protein VE338_19055 [Ktedonobacterales bacterium]|nr:hypothetical protein [Ktedonobacterales bacterium]